MDNWISRIVATLCAAGSSALFWTLGVFAAVPWHEERMLKLSVAELQLIGVPLVVGSAVAWAALHIFAIADRKNNPKTYATIRAVLITVSIGSVISGTYWAQVRIS